MPVTLSTISLLSDLAGGQSAGASKDATDGFSALLDIISPDENEVASDDGQTLAKDQRDEPTPPAVPVDVPTAFFTATKQPEQKERIEVPDVDSNTTKEILKATDEASDKPAAAKDTAAPANTNETVPATEDEAVPATGEVKAGEVSTPSETEGGLSLRDELKQIRVLLQELLQMLSSLGMVSQGQCSVHSQMCASISVTESNGSGIKTTNVTMMAEMTATFTSTSSLTLAQPQDASLDDTTLAGGFLQNLRALIAALKNSPGTETAPATTATATDFTSVVDDFQTSGDVLLAKAQQSTSNPLGALAAMKKQFGKINQVLSEFAELAFSSHDMLKHVTPAKDAAAPQPTLLLATDAPLNINAPTQAPTNLTNPTGAAPFAPVPVASDNLDSNAGNSDQDNQGNNMPAPVFGVRDTGAVQNAAGARGSEFARLLTQTSRTPVLDQVVFNIKTALQDGSSRIHIQLDPAELGKLDIKLNVGSDGKTGVVVTADNKQTLDLLQRDAGGLMRALADAGLNADSSNLSFNLGGQQEQGRDFSQASQTYLKSSPEDAESEALQAVSRTYVVNLAEGLDIRI